MGSQEPPHKKARMSSLAESISDLLSSGKYSDLEIRCDGKSFKVHRNIVCGSSIVMAKECDGGFMEAQTRIIKHSVFDSSAVDRMLQFMYRSDYHLPSACPTSPDHDSDDANAMELPTTSLSTTNHDETAVVLSVEGQEGDELIAHVYVYAIADYYEMPVLQDLAVSKFTAAMLRLEAITPDNLIKLSSVIYSNTTREAKVLRNQLFKLVCSNPWSAVDSPLFMEALTERLELQELAVDIVIKSVEHHRASEHALKANAKKLQASIDKHKAGEAARLNEIAVQEWQISIERRKVQDLVHFASVVHCMNCVALGNVARDFIYSVTARSRDKGYAANCLICKKRYTRPE